MVTVSNDKTLKIWDELTISLLYSYTDSCQFQKVVQINQTRFIVATSCGMFKVFDFFIDSTRTTANVTNGSVFSGSPYGLTLFNQTTLILGSSIGTIQIFDLNSNLSSGYKLIFDEKSSVQCLQVIDENIFAAGLFNKFISIWNLTNQTKIKSLYHASAVYSIIITNDRKFLITSDLYFKIFFWNVNNWTFFKSTSCPAYKMIQLNNYIVHITYSSASSFAIGMYVSNIENSTILNITVASYYSMIKLDNDLISLGSLSGNIEYWNLNDPINKRMIKSKLKPHAATITDIQSVKGFNINIKLKFYLTMIII